MFPDLFVEFNPSTGWLTSPVLQSGLRHGASGIWKLETILQLDDERRFSLFLKAHTHKKGAKRIHGAYLEADFGC